METDLADQQRPASREIRSKDEPTRQISSKAAAGILTSLKQDAFGRVWHPMEFMFQRPKRKWFSPPSVVKSTLSRSLRRYWSCHEGWRMPDRGPFGTGLETGG